MSDKADAAWVGGILLLFAVNIAWIGFVVWVLYTLVTWVVSK